MTQEIDRAAVGARIREARLSKGLRRHGDLVEEMGKDDKGRRVAASTIIAWEQGERLPERHMARLCKVLGRAQEWFLYGREPAAAPEAGPVDNEAAHEPVVAEYLDSERGETTPARVAEILMEGEIFAPMLRLGAPPTLDDVERMRRTLEQHLRLAPPARKLETQERSGARSIHPGSTVKTKAKPRKKGT